MKRSLPLLRTTLATAMILLITLGMARRAHSQPEAGQKQEALTQDLFDRDPDRYVDLYFQSAFPTSAQAAGAQHLKQTLSEIRAGANPAPFAARELVRPQTAHYFVGVPDFVFFPLILAAGLATVLLPWALYKPRSVYPTLSYELHPHSKGGLLLAFALWFFTAIAFTAAYGLLQNSTSLSQLRQQLLAHAIGYGVAFFFLFRWFRTIPNHSANAIGLGVPPRPMALLGLPFLVVIFLLFVSPLDAWYHFSLMMYGIAPEIQDVVQRLLHAPSGLDTALIVVFAVGIAPVCEELFHRVVLYQSLRQWLPATPAILINGAMFASVHPGISVKLAIFCIGCLLAWLFERSRNYWVCVLFHALFNGTQVALTFLLARPG